VVLKGLRVVRSVRSVVLVDPCVEHLLPKRRRVLLLVRVSKSAPTS